MKTKIAVFLVLIGGLWMAGAGFNRNDDLVIKVTNDSEVILDFNLFWLNHPFSYDEPAPICGAELKPGETFEFNREGTWKFSAEDRIFILQWSYSYMNKADEDNQAKDEYSKIYPVFVKKGALSVQMFFGKNYEVTFGKTA